MYQKLSERQRFSIRKMKKVGAGSVLLGLTFLMLSLSNNVNADEATQSESQTAVTSVEQSQPSETTEAVSSVTTASTTGEATSSSDSQKRTATVNYVVIYVDALGNEVYRVQKSTTVETDVASPATATVTESAEMSAGALSNYQLSGANSITQTLTEGAANTVTFAVSAKEEVAVSRSAISSEATTSESSSSADAAAAAADNTTEPDEADDVTDTAVTEVNFYSEGKQVATQYVKAGEVLLEPNVPVSGDKAFIGWFDGSNQIDFNQVTAFAPGTVVNIEAHFSDTVRVTFKNDTGVIVKVKEIPANSTVSAADVIIVAPKDSYVFSHWSDSPNGSAFDFDQPISTDLTLYAVIVNQKTVTFDSNGGTSVDNVYVDSGSLVGNVGQLPTPTRQGYTFNGWIDTATGRLVDTSAEVTRDYNLKAQWSPNSDTPYQIVYWGETPDGIREVNGIRYTVLDTQSLKGTTETAISYSDPAAFTALYEKSAYQPDGTVIIAGDGQSVINVYYERRKFTLTVNIFRNSTNYQVKWGTELTSYLDNKGVSSWSLRINGTDTRLARLNYPMPTYSTTATAGTYNYTAHPTIYYLDIDTGETFRSQVINSDVGSTLNLNSATEGYDFVRFEGQADGVTQIRITEAHNWNGIRAYFRKKKYNVTFITNNDSISNFVSTVDYKSNVLPLVPTSMTQYVTKKTDEYGVKYVFTGWYDNAATSGNPIDFTSVTVPAGGLIYYAGWAKEYIPVTVHKDTVLSDSSTDKYILLVNSGNTVLDQDNKYAKLNTDGSIQYDAIGTPIVDNSKTFSGNLEVNNKINFDGSILEPIWYKLVNGRLEKVNLETEITEAGMILVPVWTYPTKKVTYDANGGSNPPATSDVEFQQNIKIVEQGDMTPPSEDLVFVGWNTKSDGTGTRYTPKQILGFNQFSGDNLTLYAQWTKDANRNYVGVTYNPNGGLGQTVTKQYLNNQVIYIRNQGYSRSGYHLIGWSTNPDGPEEYPTGKKIAASNIVLYAIWTEKLTANVTSPNILIDKVPVEILAVVTSNKTDAIINPSQTVNGLFINGQGNLQGTPSITNWSGNDDEERQISISVTVSLKVVRSSGNSTNESVVVNVPITVQRDTDGDGDPDVTDADDDNDGILDVDDKNPKVADSSAPEISADNATIVEKTPVSLPVSASDADDKTVDVTVSGLPNGLSHDAVNNQITGSASGETWTDASDESHAYTVTITASDSAGHTTTKDITITVQRDTDGDGDPDVTDADDDNDGILDRYDELPKSPNAMKQIVNIEIYYLNENGVVFVKEVLTGVSNAPIESRVYIAPSGYHFDPHSIFVDPVEYTLSEDNKVLIVFGTYDDSFNPEGFDTEPQLLRAILVKDEIPSAGVVPSLTTKTEGNPNLGSTKNNLEVELLPETGDSNLINISSLGILLATLGIFGLKKKDSSED